MKTKTAKAAQTLRAVTYSRFSSDAQRASSIEDQQRNCQRRADHEGWTIVDEYADHAISGSDSRRPQYQAMLKAATRGEFDVLLIDDQSRLTRDALESEKTFRKLEFSGIRIVGVSDGYDSTSKSRRIQRGFKAIMNETFLDDLRERVHRGHMGQALKGRWNGGRPYGYKLKPVLDASQRDAYGNALQIGTMLEIDATHAKIVREIFAKYVAGHSHRAIATELNARNVPSVGTTWKRKKHRASGWMGSAIRVITRNPLYIGQQRWNTTQFVRNPETEKYIRRKRPKSEWVVNQSEALRIVSDAVFAKAQARSNIRSSADGRLKKGGKLRYLLSGLLKCHACGANYVLADVAKYACSSYVNGGACSNKTRVRRDVLEREIIGPIKDDLLSPARVARMAKEMQRRYAERVKATQQKGADAPRQLSELDARLERLRERLRNGDPDLTDDELQAAIDRAQAKRQELAAATQPAGSAAAKVLSMLPKAAEAYRKQVIAGLDGDLEATARARDILRDLVGTVTIKSEGEQVWGEFEARPDVLLGVADRIGRGDRI